MQDIDFSPFFRSVIGFDRVAELLDAASRDQMPSYPPYNIEKVDEESYRITMAVAGFSREDLDISVEGDVLTIAGKANSDADTRHYLHRGIAGRSFQRRFNLAEHVQVKSAALENGLLHVDLVHEVPEALKPRTIKIESGSGKSWRKAITGEAA